MRVMVAMSGGVDSSVAAALLKEGGHDVVGVTLKLWGGAGDSGCCSVADVEDARRVAEQLGLDHHIFDFVSEFEETVVDPYVRAHSKGDTPNPCIECNRHMKFGKLLVRARRLGFDAVATGHHARVVDLGAGGWQLRRGADIAKDQSYVLSMLTQAELPRLLMPVGDLTKERVREQARALRLRTASKPDSQDVCFIHSASGRHGFLSERLELHPGEVVDRDGSFISEVPAVELVTVGQRRGLGLGGSEDRRYAVSVDIPRRRVVIDDGSLLLRSEFPIGPATWVDKSLDIGARALVQVSAHGRVFPATYGGEVLVPDTPQRVVARGQTVAMYDPGDPDAVVGSAIAA